MSDSLPSHGLQCTRLPCPSSIPGACSNIYPSSCWCHPSISSSVIPFFSCLQYFPASGSFPMSQFFTSGGQNIGASASAPVLPMNIQDRFPLGLTDLLAVQGTLKSLLQQLELVHPAEQIVCAQAQMWKLRKCMLVWKCDSWLPVNRSLMSRTRLMSARLFIKHL